LVDSAAGKRDSRLNDEPAPMRFTQTVPAIAASLALAACATAGPSGHSAAATRSPAEAHAACEALIYRAPAPGDAAALDCAHRLDLWR
jgi:outer membrane PBP1 activator LpoA protein